MWHNFGKSARDRDAKFAALDRVQAIIEFDLQGTILNANANFLKVLGYTLEEIRGKHHSIFVETAVKDSPEYQAFWDKLRAGQFEAGQFKRIAKGGREVWIEASYNPLIDGHGKPYRVVKFATDITRRSCEDAERAGELAAIRRSQAVISFTVDGRILDANDNFLRAVGYSLPEIQGKHHWIFIDAATKAGRDYARFWDSLRQGEYQAG